LGINTRIITQKYRQKPVTVVVLVSQSWTNLLQHELYLDIKAQIYFVREIVIQVHTKKKTKHQA